MTYHEMNPEMTKLLNVLRELNVPHAIEHTYQGYPTIILLNKDREAIGDAVCSPSTYGYDSGLMECGGFGCPSDDTVGWCCAIDVLRLWLPSVER